MKEVKSETTKEKKGGCWKKCQLNEHSKRQENQAAAKIEDDQEINFKDNQSHDATPNLDSISLKHERASV